MDLAVAPSAQVHPALVASLVLVALDEYALYPRGPVVLIIRRVQLNPERGRNPAFVVRLVLDASVGQILADLLDRSTGQDDAVPGKCRSGRLNHDEATGAVIAGLNVAVCLDEGWAPMDHNFRLAE